MAKLRGESRQSPALQALAFKQGPLLKLGAAGQGKRLEEGAAVETDGLGQT